MANSFTIQKIILIIGCYIYYRKLYWKFKYIKTYNNPNMTITAHTGCGGTEPNSRESLQVGYKSGAQILELDLYFDSNGIPYLSHGKIKGNEIKLEEAFKFLSNRLSIKANIDIKRVDNMPSVFHLITLYNLSNRVFFTGVKEKFV